MASLADLVGRDVGGALRVRASIPTLAAELAGVALGSELAWRASILEKSASLTLLAGSGSRWQASLAKARDEGRLDASARDFDPSLPRGLFPVRDYLRGGSTIAIAAYAIAAVSGEGSHIIAVRGHEDAIRSEILSALGLDDTNWAFFTQDAPYGKPLGHGDAAWQCRSLWRGATWLVTNFGGDASSRHTVESTILAMAALDEAGRGVDLLIPAARVDNPAYPIGLDADGLARSFGHNKLHGGTGIPHAGRVGESAYCNVGTRVYRASALAELLEELRDRYWVSGRGYAIPGNDPSGAEMALDNADAEFARRGRARILAIAAPDELSPAKSYDDIAAYERAIARVRNEDEKLIIS